MTPLNWYVVGTSTATSTDYMMFSRVQDDLIYGILIGFVMAFVITALKGRKKK